MIGRRPVLASVVLALSFGSSCTVEREPEQTEPTKPQQPEPAKPEPAKPEPAKPEVQTPTPPKPEAPAGPDVPTTYDDGAYSVRGLRETFGAGLEAAELARVNRPFDAPEVELEEVLVRAFVVHIYARDPSCLDCPQAHIWVADGPEVKARETPELAMLVGPTLFDLPEDQAKIWADEPEVEFEVGKQYLLKGNFVRRGDTGFTDPLGVLQFIAVQGGAGEWIIPRGADWHPKTQALWAAEDAAMMEKMLEDQRRLRSGR